jgi:hypothetical protein
MKRHGREEDDFKRHIKTLIFNRFVKLFIFLRQMENNPHLI